MEVGGREAARHEGVARQELGGHGPGREEGGVEGGVVGAVSGGRELSGGRGLFFATRTILKIKSDGTVIPGSF